MSLDSEPESSISLASYPRRNFELDSTGGGEKRGMGRGKVGEEEGWG